MGAPFHGHSVLGDEAHKKKYVAMWADSIASVMVTAHVATSALKPIEKH